jgi:hypothetical protein
MRSGIDYRVWGWLCASVIFLGPGCRSHSQLAPVSGVVRLDGRPTEKLSVTFFPAAGRAANGVTGHDGRFVLATYKPGDGALIGTHTITIATMLDPPIALPTDLAKAKRTTQRIALIPAKYGDIRTTDLKRAVEADRNNEFEFDISSK